MQKRQLQHDKNGNSPQAWSLHIWSSGAWLPTCLLASAAACVVWTLGVRSPLKVMGSTFAAVSMPQMLLFVRPRRDLDWQWD